MLEMIVQVAPSNGSFCHPLINVSAEVKQKEDVGQKFVSMRFTAVLNVHIFRGHILRRAQKLVVKKHKS